jgi:hypothetical protein
MMINNLCPSGHEVVYQPFSGGKEWYCETCDVTGLYDYDSIPESERPRAWLLTRPQGADKLREEMQKDLETRA